MVNTDRLIAELRRRYVVGLPRDPTRPILFFAGPVYESGIVHIHQGMELAVVLDREIEVELDGVSTRLKRGDVWLAGMWEPHCLIHRDRKMIATFQFLPEAVEAKCPVGAVWPSMFVAPPSQRPRIVDRQGRSDVLDVVADLCREARSRRPLWYEVIYLGLLRILVELQRGWDTPDRPALGPAAYADAFHRIMPAIQLLKPCLGRRVSSQEAARACDVSMPWFATLFRSAMGLSFGEFSLRSRVGFAARQLLSSRRSVHTIAQQEGFTDASHLHRYFVRYCGCTPSYYREHGSVADSTSYEGLFWQLHTVPDLE